MATTYLAALAPVLLGDDVPLEVTVTDADGADISAYNGFLTVVAEDGTELLVTEPMIGIGTVERVFRYTLTTGPMEVIETAGRYTNRYLVTDGTSEKWFEQAFGVRAVPATYPGVVDWVYVLLPSVDESKVDFVVQSVVAEMLMMGSCFSTYGELTPTEQIFFNKAAGMKSAYLLYNLPTTTTTTGTGAIKKKKSGDQEIEYDVGSSSSTVGNTAYWLEEYEKAFSVICPEAFVDISRRARSSIPVSTLPNSFDPRDSLYPSDVERAAEVVV